MPSGTSSARDHVGAQRVFLLVLTILAVWVAQSFLLSLAWAAIISVAIWPAYSRFHGRSLSRRRNVGAPLTATLITGLILMLPLAAAAVEAAGESHAAMQWLNQAQQGMPVPNWLPHIPLIGPRAATWWQANLSDARAASNILGRIDMGAIARWSGAIASELAARSIFFLITLAALFIMLREGERLAVYITKTGDQLLGRSCSPFTERIVLAIRGTVVGTVFVALGEGALIGAGYALAGVPRPVLFGLVTVAFAMLPFGAWVVFGAASALLLVQGHGLVALGLFGWGGAVMLISDNLVQPALIGSKVRLPFLFAMIGTFGGLQMFGLVGLFLGPVIMAAFLLGWQNSFLAAGNAKSSSENEPLRRGA